MHYILIDGGFREGVYTEDFLKKHPDNTTVFAYEPYQMNMRKVEELSRTYETCDINAVEVALWICEGLLDFHPATRIDGGSLVDGMKHKADTPPVKVLCIDTAVMLEEARRKNPGKRLHMKLDIEGAEYAILNHLLDKKALLPEDELVVEWHIRQNRTLRDTHTLLLERLALNNIKYLDWK